MAEPRRVDNLRFSLIQNRDDIFTVSWDTLKEEFKILRLDQFIEFIDYLNDDKWLSSLTIPQLDDLTNLLLCSVTLEQCKELIERFMVILDRRRTEGDKDNSKYGPSETSIWNLYNRNYEIFEHLTLKRWTYLSTGNREILTTIEEKRLCIVEAVLTKDFYCPKIVDDLFPLLSLEHKARHNDLLDIILDSNHLEYLDRVLELWTNRYGQEQNKEKNIKEFLFRGRRSWVSYKTKDPLGDLKTIMVILEKYDVATKELIYIPEGDNDILVRCNSLEMIQFCLEKLPKDKVKEALQKRGHRLLMNILESVKLDEKEGNKEGDRVGEFDTCMFLLEKEGVDTSPIFLSRDHSDGLTLLDYVCLHRNVSYVQAIFNRMSDKDKKILLFTKNYGGRDPLAHARYYNFKGNPTKEALIHSEMVRLTH